LWLVVEAVVEDQRTTTMLVVAAVVLVVIYLDQPHYVQQLLIPLLWAQVDHKFQGTLTVILVTIRHFLEQD
jgi:hypothetical protein